MALEDTLQKHEERVDALLKLANNYVKALRAWKKACQMGHIANLQKTGAQADQLCRALPDETVDVRASWNFDLAGYLDSNAWRDELRDTAADCYSLRTLDDGDNLIASPVTVRAHVGRGILLIGKSNWPSIRPRVVARELKRLRDKTANANSQDFLESVFHACQYLSGKDTPGARFQDIYKLFCLSPGYKRLNPSAAFGQQIYALHRSGIVATRAGHRFEIEFPSGNAKDSDVFAVTTEDGRLVRYYNIWFKVV